MPLTSCEPQRASILTELLEWCRELVSPVDMTTKTIIKRIVNNSKEYEVRQAKKLKSEAAYYSETKEFVGER